MFDFDKIFRLDPFRDYPTNSSKDIQFHRQFGRAYKLAALFFIALLIWGRWTLSVSWIDHCADIACCVAIMLILMAAFGLVLQFFQSKSIKHNLANKVYVKGGRNPLSRIEYGDDPLRDNNAKRILDRLMDMLGGNIDSVKGYSLLMALQSNQGLFFKEKYENKNLAAWLYQTYSRHFCRFDPVSMTKASSTKTKEEIQKDIETIMELIEKIKKEMILPQ